MISLENQAILRCDNWFQKGSFTGLSQSHTRIIQAGVLHGGKAKPNNSAIAQDSWLTPLVPFTSLERSCFLNQKLGRSGTDLNALGPTLFQELFVGALLFQFKISVIRGCHVNQT